MVVINLGHGVELEYYKRIVVGDSKSIDNQGDVGHEVLKRYSV